MCIWWHTGKLLNHAMPQKADLRSFGQGSQTWARWRLKIRAWSTPTGFRGMNCASNLAGFLKVWYGSCSRPLYSSGGSGIRRTGLDAVLVFFAVEQSYPRNYAAFLA